MIKITSDQFEFLLPLACEWAEAKEKVVLKHGIPLSNSQIEDAKRVGVIHPGSAAKMGMFPQNNRDSFIMMIALYRIILNLDTAINQLLQSFYPS